MFDLTGRVAIVTGGSRGIGRAACVALGEAGALVLVNYRSNAEAAEQTLVGSGVDDEAIAAAVAAATAITEPVSDGRGPAEFRTHVAGVMVERAVKAAADRAS